MQDSTFNALIILMLFGGIFLLASPLLYLLFKAIPDGLIERWRYGKPILANERYAPQRSVKVDPSVYKKQTRPAERQLTQGARKNMTRPL